MSTDEYVPSEAAVKLAWADRRLFLDSMGEGDPSPDAVYNAEFDRFLARVRRDAAREALDGLAAESRELAHEMEPHDQGANAYTARAARIYRDTHYPEETP